MDHASDGFSRYLSAKRSVDDRALNRHVLDALRAELAKHSHRCLRIVEVGAGLGTMVARMLDWRIVSRAEYLLLDVDEGLLVSAGAWLSAWATARGLSAEHDGQALRIRGAPDLDVVVRFVTAELDDFLARPRSLPAADLLVANAVLDLLDVPAVISRLFELVSEGLYWFTLNFDGETIFEPAHPDDAVLLGAYHRSMDERVRDGRPSGDSRCGRHLFGHLAAAGATIVAAGASDWVVHPPGGGYAKDDATLIGEILDTIGNELRRHPRVEAQRLDAWLALRRGQLAQGRLVYIAHQLDFCGRAPGPRA